MEYGGWDICVTLIRALERVAPPPSLSDARLTLQFNPRSTLAAGSREECSCCRWMDGLVRARLCHDQLA